MHRVRAGPGGGIGSYYPMQVGAGVHCIDPVGTSGTVGGGPLIIRPGRRGLSQEVKYTSRTE